MSSGYHSLKSYERSSFLTIFACHFCRYRYRRLPFGAAPESDMFQWKIDKNFKNLPNVFGIADGTLVVGYDSDGKDHDEMLWYMVGTTNMQACELKTYQRQMPFQVYISPILC